MGGIVEFLEIVPALFVAVTAMLIALTRLEQDLGREPAPSRTAAPRRAGMVTPACLTQDRAAEPSTPPGAQLTATAQQIPDAPGR